MGKVADIDINLPQWTVNHIILKIGMIKKLSIGMNIIDKVGDKIISLNRRELPAVSAAGMNCLKYPADIGVV